MMTLKCIFKFKSGRARADVDPIDLRPDLHARWRWSPLSLRESPRAPGCRRRGDQVPPLQAHGARAARAGGTAKSL